MKKVLKIAGIIISLFIIGAASILFMVTRGLKEGAAMKINDVDLSKLQDGKYHGVYEEKRWLSEVEVTVKNHRITKIELLSKPMVNPGGPNFSGELINRVIEQQTPNVDVISGATVSSKAYLKSIENALVLSK